MISRPTCFTDRNFAAAAIALNQLERAVKHRLARDSHFETAKHALQTLPATIADLALAYRRLDNALAYYLQGEAGAARYELVLLHHVLGHSNLN